MYFIDLHNILLFLFIILSTSGIVRFRRKPSWPADKCTVHVFGAEVQRQAEEQSTHITSLCNVLWASDIVPDTADGGPGLTWSGGKAIVPNLLHKRITCVAYESPMPMPYSRLVKLESLGVGARRPYIFCK